MGEDILVHLIHPIPSVPAVPQSIHPSVSFVLRVRNGTEMILFFLDPLLKFGLRGKQLLPMRHQFFAGIDILRNRNEQDRIQTGIRPLVGIIGRI